MSKTNKRKQVHAHVVVDSDITRISSYGYVSGDTRNFTSQEKMLEQMICSSLNGSLQGRNPEWLGDMQNETQGILQCVLSLCW